MITDYDALTRAIREAGFFWSGIEDRGTWHRITVCSERRPDGRLGGNSFWVSRIDGQWYLGTWRPSLYRLPDEERVAELCITWLSRAPAPTRFDFDMRLKAEFHLELVDEDAFDELTQEL
jgi:hypothetical protein